MAKDKQNNKHKSLFREKLNRIQEAQKQMEKETKKVLVECAHQNEKGKLKIYPVNEHGEYECKYCKQRFNMDIIKEHILDGSIKVVHDAIQQIRCHSDAEEDAKLIRLLGELDFNIQETKELYTRVVTVYGKGKGNKDKRNKNRNNENNDGYGSYGSGPLSFISSGGGKRR